MPVCVPRPSRLGEMRPDRRPNRPRFGHTDTRVTGQAPCARRVTAGAVRSLDDGQTFRRPPDPGPEGAAGSSVGVDRSGDFGGGRGSAAHRHPGQPGVRALRGRVDASGGHGAAGPCDRPCPSRPARLPGAIVLRTPGSYPHVHPLARAAFLGQSQHLMEAAPAPGHGRAPAFRRVALTMAWPAIETLADDGAVIRLRVPALTTGTFRTWFARGARWPQRSFRRFLSPRPFFRSGRFGAGGALPRTRAGGSGRRGRHRLIRSAPPAVRSGGPRASSALGSRQRRWPRRIAPSGVGCGVGRRIGRGEACRCGQDPAGVSGGPAVSEAASIRRWAGRSFRPAQ